LVTSQSTFFLYAPHEIPVLNYLHIMAKKETWRKPKCSRNRREITASQVVGELKWEGRQVTTVVSSDLLIRLTQIQPCTAAQNSFTEFHSVNSYNEIAIKIASLILVALLIFSNEHNDGFNTKTNAH